MWLEIEASVQRKDKASMSRDILWAWAKEKAHAYKLATKRMQANGLQPELFGDDCADLPADDGMGRNGQPKQGGRR